MLGNCLFLNYVIFRLNGSHAVGIPFTKRHWLYVYVILTYIYIYIYIYIRFTLSANVMVKLADVESYRKLGYDNRKLAVCMNNLTVTTTVTTLRWKMARMTVFQSNSFRIYYDMDGERSLGRWLVFWLILCPTDNCWLLLFRTATALGNLQLFTILDSNCRLEHMRSWLLEKVSLSLFHGISTFVGYLMPKPSCWKTVNVLFNAYLEE